jgi:hypothetical protein
MRTDASITNDNPALDGALREGPTVAQVVELLQTAYPINWEQLLRARLAGFGISDLADLTPAMLAKFRDQVFWSVRQSSIKDPAAWIANQEQFKAKAAAAKLPYPVGADDTAAQRKSAGREPVAVENSPATASTASALPPIPRPVYGTTKADVLNRAKAAIGSKERLRDIAERLACAHIDFDASQREISRAITRSPSWVNRLLKWRQSGYEQCSPFGPTTRAGRTTRRNDSNNDLGGCGGDEQVADDGTVSSVGHCSPPSQPASPRAPVNENLPSGSPQTEPLPDGEAATRETKGVEPQPTPVENGSLHLQKPKLPARNSKLSPERMRIVIAALKERPILAPAAAKAGIHRKTLTYWLKCSEAGQDSYDIEWEGFQWRFHEACEAVIDEAWQRLLGVMRDIAMGSITYKIDRDLVELGNRGADAYARDENGEFIVEARGPVSVKMVKFLLQLLCPERWGKARKREREIFRSGGVLVIGERPNRSEKNCAASIRARQWKSASRKIWGDKGLTRPALS